MKVKEGILAAILAMLLSSAFVYAANGSVTVPRPEHPRPDMLRENWMTLNGEWQFEIDKAAEGYRLGPQGQPASTVGVRAGGARGDSRCLAQGLGAGREDCLAVEFRAGAAHQRGVVAGVLESELGAGLRGKATDWTVVAHSSQFKDGKFSGSIRLAAGGWYTLKVRFRKSAGDPAVLGEAAVEHVGVGDVFVVAGQSNAANHGQEKQNTKTGLVAAFDGKHWQLANDPQPGSQHCLGREEGQQENQGIPEQFASTNKKVAEVYQKVLYGIHAAKIIQLVARNNRGLYRVESAQAPNYCKSSLNRHKSSNPVSFNIKVIQAGSSPYQASTQPAQRSP